MEEDVCFSVAVGIVGRSAFTLLDGSWTGRDESGGGCEALRPSCGNEARTLASRRSKSGESSAWGKDSIDSAVRFRAFLRWTPGRLPPPLPRLGGTLDGSPVAATVITEPSFPFFRLLDNERAYRNPQALQSVLCPEGPRRHSGLSALPQLVHVFTGPAIACTLPIGTGATMLGAGM